MTTVESNSILKSTIQEREKEKDAVTISQEICTILRQDLSILRKEDINKKLVETIERLNNNKIEPDQKHQNQMLITKKLLGKI